ncbi:hypothetical protein L2E82_45984 [Cichorium intybus]|uniref:Uncharacterized protein n=1 Tax=Cichorium intybus TaxID=13427 RepID=A0ACB8ZUH6_CICIN|nr:hypothetical protein L2E82_45984 [Cichorium intybus]
MAGRKERRKEEESKRIKAKGSENDDTWPETNGGQATGEAHTVALFLFVFGSETGQQQCLKACVASIAF